MKDTKPVTTRNLPVLTDVLIPGHRAARGQQSRVPRVSEEVTEEEPLQAEDDGYEDLLNESLGTLDVEGAIDRVLDKHAEAVKADLREEFERLLQQVRNSRF